MSEWYDSQKNLVVTLKLLLERIDKANQRRTLTAEEQKWSFKLQGITDKLKRGENVQNRQLQT